MISLLFLFAVSSTFSSDSMSLSVDSLRKIKVISSRNERGQPVTFSAERILVQMKPNASADSVQNIPIGKVVEYFPTSRVAIIAIPVDSPQAYIDQMKALEANPAVQQVIPDYIFKLNIE